MTKFLLPLLLASFSIASAQLVTVECSDGQAQFELADLRASKCLRIIQSEFMNPNSQVKNLFLKGIDTKSLGLFIKLSKLNDAKVFAFIDSLDPDAFRLIDYYAKYLRLYHELDSLFKYKYLKEYSLQDANRQIIDFVDSKYFAVKFVDGKWQQINLFGAYFGPQFASFTFPQNSITNDYRAFFALIDFYQTVMKKPLKITTDHLKFIFNSLDSAIQNQLIKKQLVMVP